MMKSSTGINPYEERKMSTRILLRRHAFLAMQIA
jgi:hypothetical protein